MRASWYSKALYELLATQDDADRIIERFVSVVRTNGHTHLLPKIVKSFEAIVKKNEKEGTISIISAEPLSQDKIVALLKKEPFKHSLSAFHKRVERKTDSTLIGGVIVRSKSTRIDASYKRMLLDLYEKMTINL